MQTLLPSSDLGFHQQKICIQQHKKLVDGALADCWTVRLL